MINMKIEVNEEQPLDEIVKDLEKLGYRSAFITKSDTYCIQTYQATMVYEMHQESSFKWLKGKYTTLAELKEM